MRTSPPFDSKSSRQTAQSESFDSVADRYDAELQSGLVLSGESPDYFVQGRVARLASRMRQRGWQTGSVLDFGCGVGNAASTLMSQLNATTIIGLDPSQESLTIAAQRYPDPRYTWTTNGESIAPGSIDLAYTSGVFHHIPPDQRQAALHRIHTWLKPGSCFALFENNPWNPGTRWVMSRIPFDRDAICLSSLESRRRLQQAGFIVEGTEYLFFFPRALSLLRPCESWLRACPCGAQYVVWARKA